MRVYGRGRVQHFLGDFIVYRNLIPLDRRLPGLPDLRRELEVPTSVTPRKTSPEYARVIGRILDLAQEMRGVRSRIESLLYIGDTRVNDGTAFINLLESGGWNGAAFICSETTGTEEHHVEEVPAGTILSCNRWSAIASFDAFCAKRGIRIDKRTAVVIDIDKTAIGARGRNDHVIDEVRLLAMRRTARELLGDAFDEQEFQADYARLNQPLYHPFTTDNQDYLAYTCLILQGGVIPSEELFNAIDKGELTQFSQLLSLVDDRKRGLSPSLQRMHSSVRDAFSRGDPTPFVNFRHNEYKVTVEHMGRLKDGTPAEQLLQEEIVITREVMEYALHCRHTGALVFGLSDKPDEASIPNERIDNYMSLHATETHIVGGG